MIAFYQCRYCSGWNERLKGWRILCYSPEALVDAVVLNRGNEGWMSPGYVEPVEEPCLPDIVALQRHHPSVGEFVDALPSGSPQQWEVIRQVDQAACELLGWDPGEAWRRNRGLFVGGYPGWANGPDETPVCPICSKWMELLLQISPSELVGCTWGDVGTLYFFRCAEHFEQFDLAMQCT